MKQTITRRKMLKAMLGASAVPYLAFGPNRALAQTAQVDLEGAQAKALQYSHQSALADQFCGNCKLYTGDAASDWGPCAIFPGQKVASAGWCKAWIAKG
ncbi:MAG: hypothetical protein ACI9LO_002177 [Planctomycetota bacterium]|jgi:hypothetical protein